MEKMLKNYNQQQHKAFCVNVADVHVIPGKLFFVSKRVYSKFVVFFHFISLLKLSISGISPPPQGSILYTNKLYTTRFAQLFVNNAFSLGIHFLEDCPIETSLPGPAFHFGFFLLSF